MNESWRNVWRKAVHNLFTVPQLESLRIAIVRDDVRLIQGATTSPPPLQCVQDWPVEACCLLSYPFAVDLGGFADPLDIRSPHAATVGETEEAFARICFEIDNLIGEPAACRFLLNWFDDTPRDEMRRELLVEVQRSLALKLQETDNAAL